MTESRTGNPALPNFLMVGVAKAGTSWIFEILREHPEVFVPVAKDIYFFDRYFDRGLEWYGRFFQAAGGAKAVGEICHDYYLSATSAARIREVLPGARIICCLREPGDRLASGYTYNLSTDRSKEMTFEEYIELPEIARHVDYCATLKPFYDLFPREKILILFYDDLKKDPAAFARTIFEFLGVDPDFEPTVLRERVNVAHEARVEWVAHCAYRIAQLLRHIGFANLVGAVKRSPFFEKLLYKGKPGKAAVPEDVLERVRTRYRQEYGRLSDMIGRPLPPEWY